MLIDRRQIVALVLALSFLGCTRQGSPFVSGPKTEDGGSAATSAGATTGEDPTDTGGDAGDTGAVSGTGTDIGTDTGTGTGVPNGSLSLTVGTWNLHNFSKYGTSEYRIDDIAGVIESLDVDVLAVQELKVKDGSNGNGEQAFDALLELLPDHDGVHAKWDSNDSTVGLIYRTSTTTLESTEEIYTNEWSAFPRQPLVAEVTVSDGEGSSNFKVIVLHLKAFKDDFERRREACKLLVEYIDKQSDKRFIIIGDMNDDPYDAPEKNSYVGTFLDAEPDYHFVSAVLPLGTVTSTGYGTSVNGDWKDGEFLDHAILTGSLYSSFQSVDVEVIGKPESEFSTWKKDFSDHFPLLVHLVQAAGN